MTILFSGFSYDTINFLKDLRDNNNKQWFEENREKYSRCLLEPMKELASELSPLMLSIDPMLEIAPAKVISRIYRDVRFSKDKSPYRANMWIAFKRIYLDWKAEPCYFFEIFPDCYRFGMGFYNIPRETLQKLRDMIDEDSKAFRKVFSMYEKQSTFIIEGEKYKRIINQELPDKLNEWYQRKEIYMTCNRQIDDRLFSSSLVNDISEGFRQLEPVYGFFMSLRDKKI